MNILQVIEPGMNGAFRHVQDLSEFLISKGHRVSLAYSSVRCCSQLFDLVKKVSQNGGQTLDLKISNKPGIKDIPALYQIMRFCKQQPFHAIHTHSSKAGALIRFLELAGCLRVPIFHTPHAYYGMAELWDRNLHWPDYVESLLSKANALTINVSEDERHYAMKKLNILDKQIAVVFNSVNFERFKPVSEKQKQIHRQTLNISDKDFVICSVARISPQKNVSTLYRAFAEFKKVIPKCHLIHVGTGKDIGGIEALEAELGISNNVTRVPFIEDPLPIYQVSDCFALTSLYEGLPLVVLEAIACNLPLVLSDVPGHSIFKNIGLTDAEFSRPMNIKSFVNGFLQNYHKWRNQNGPNHREIGLQYFHNETNQAKILDLYRKALQ
jgi:glycosyltransferase involved in cell wall biosynthesis